MAALISPALARAADDPRKEQARQEVEAGGARFAAGDFAAALKHFQAAYQAYPNAKILFNVGKAALEVHDAVLAANAFGAFMAGSSATPEILAQREFASEKLGALASKLGRV